MPVFFFFLQTKQYLILKQEMSSVIQYGESVLWQNKSRLAEREFFAFKSARKVKP